ncbi:MAG: hypothetical protein JO006_16070 [Paucibacter sp.]|nr:hypothetical protein [Roseateles sp.]
MDKHEICATSAAVLTGLGSRLREAARARNWSALMRLDAEVAALLRGFKREQCRPTDLAAWMQLRTAHENALQDCQREMQRLGETLEQMLQHREGWQAYAASQDWPVELRKGGAA